MDYAAAQETHLKILGLDKGVIPDDKPDNKLEESEVIKQKYTLYHPHEPLSMTGRLAKTALNKSATINR
jgi:hypothetical protein